ncbi:MAG: hypothetical protein M1828_003304 [Chrysothrix sp. TS-e1954]|nr:MAG: hypothetical protein M1828_003304 [Chrysothrix sp. TS-e1954]
MSQTVTSKRQLQKASAKRDATNSPPPPFSRVPLKLEPFVEHLNTAKVYIVHLDTLPWQSKRQIFTVPVLLNLTIAGLLIWRVLSIWTFYVDLFCILLGYETPTNVDTSSQTTNALVLLTLRRLCTIAFDFFLSKVILPWPITFFLEAPANPCTWRWHVGFKDTEIIVRVSRDWGASDLNDSLKQGEDNPFFKVRILPAIDKRYMHGKSGYLMMGKDYDLDFDAMTYATQLVTKGSMTFQDFEKTVIVHSEAHGWMAWNVHPLDTGSEEEARKKIIAFKERLTAMRKESLFFRWIELIQYESNQPGGFTPERRTRAVTKAKALFEEQGVNFEDFLTSVGGLEEFPGLDESQTSGS